MLISQHHPQSTGGPQESAFYNKLPGESDAGSPRTRLEKLLYR